MEVLEGVVIVGDEDHPTTLLAAVLGPGLVLATTDADNVKKILKIPSLLEAVHDEDRFFCYPVPLK